MKFSENGPKARANGILIEYDQNKNSYLLIGGSDRNQGHNDIWLLLINEKKWEKILIPELTNIFTPRCGVAYSVIDNNDNHLTMFIHGGQDYFNQTFYKCIPAPLLSSSSLDIPVQKQALYVRSGALPGNPLHHGLLHDALLPAP